MAFCHEVSLILGPVGMGVQQKRHTDFPVCCFVNGFLGTLASPILSKETQVGDCPMCDGSNIICPLASILFCDKACYRALNFELKSVKQGWSPALPDSSATLVGILTEGLIQLCGSHVLHRPRRMTHTRLVDVINL
jgi:hypothetical protein